MVLHGIGICTLGFSLLGIWDRARISIIGNIIMAGGQHKTGGVHSMGWSLGIFVGLRLFSAWRHHQTLGVFSLMLTGSRKMFLSLHWSMSMGETISGDR